MRVFWKRRDSGVPEWPGAFGPLADLPETSARPLAEVIEIKRGASRAAAISQVTEELKRRGEKVVEIFGTVASPAGHADMPIHLWRGGEDVFVEVETGPWKGKTVDDILQTAAVLRGSEYSDAAFEVLSAYPVPEDISYFFGRTPAALFQLDLIRHVHPKNPEACTRAFRNAAERRWGLNGDYDPEKLPLVEELLLAALNGGSENGTRAPILDVLVLGLGCYVGEILRRRAAPGGSWCSTGHWSEGLTIEFPNVTADPIGKVHSFLQNGAEDSVAYYVSYALEELNG